MLVYHRVYSIESFNPHPIWWLIYPHYKYYRIIIPSLSGWWLTYSSEKSERQLGWWPSQYDGKIIHSCSKPPTSYVPVRANKNDQMARSGLPRGQRSLGPIATGSPSLDIFQWGESQQQPDDWSFWIGKRNILWMGQRYPNHQLKRVVYISQ